LQRAEALVTNQRARAQALGKTARALTDFAHRLRSLAVRRRVDKAVREALIAEAEAIKTDTVALRAALAPTSRPIRKRPR
jgi:hypothetical protein